jgi:uncharacterized membrane protein YedE/YeeE
MKNASRSVISIVFILGYNLSFEFLGIDRPDLWINVVFSIGIGMVLYFQLGLLGK